MLHVGNRGNREKRAQLRMKNQSEAVGLVVKLFTYFRDLSLIQSTRDPTNPNLMSPRCVTLNCDSIFLLQVVLQLSAGVCSEPRHHQDAPLC